MAATYDETKWSARDELRALFRDNDILPNSTTVADPVLSDTVYDVVLRNNGLREGAVKLAHMVSSYWLQEARKYANTQSGTAVEFENRAQTYRLMAEDIRLGRIVLGQGTPFKGAVLTGSFALDNDLQEFEELGVWPFPGYRAE